MLLKKTLTLLRSMSRPQVCIKHSLIHTVVMLRHGESLWNVENRFTGWYDVPLTEAGKREAVDAGALIGERGLKFDVAFTSNLERAWKTCALTLNAAGQPDVETIRSSKLNERHYGALQGHLKDSQAIINAYGEDTVVEWRRSYSISPPATDNLEFLQKVGLPDTSMIILNSFIKKYSCHSNDNIDDNDDTPKTESLKLCEERAFGYWKEVIAPRVASGERVLIVAHANTIRALVKAVDKIQDQDIAHLKIPNGIPLIYTMDENLQPYDNDANSVSNDDIGFQANYLVSAKNHSKMMQYERCVRKKLRGLFEYLDSDNDGRITPDCLLNGLAKLHRDNTVDGESIFKSKHAAVAAAVDGYQHDEAIRSNDDTNIGIGNGSVYTIEKESESRQKNKIQSDFCEYEIEELIRCVPNADEYGGITLKAFLQAEESLLPKLRFLKLLQ